MEAKETILAAFFEAIEDEISKRLSEKLDKEFHYARCGLISVKNAAKYMNTSEEMIIKMINDDKNPLRAVKKGSSEHNSIFFSSVIEYMERLKSPDFQYDNYYRNEQGAREKATKNNIRDCERLGIEPKFKFNK